jgi:hypothetical protein
MKVHVHQRRVERSLEGVCLDYELSDMGSNTCSTRVIYLQFQPTLDSTISLIKRVQGKRARGAKRQMLRMREAVPASQDSKILRNKLKSYIPTNVSTLEKVKLSL